jgi:5-methylcytosine-specific restriction endonuclease McrA
MGFCGPRCQSDWNSEWRKGLSKSEEHKKKIGDAHRGKPNRKNQGKSCPIQGRNNNTCQSCGKKGEDGENLDVHHTYPLNNWIDDGHDPNDYPDDWLVTLDKSCHTKADAQDGEFKLPPKEA